MKFEDREKAKEDILELSTSSCALIENYMEHTLKRITEELRKEIYVLESKILSKIDQKKWKSIELVSYVLDPMKQSYHLDGKLIAQFEAKITNMKLQVVKNIFL